MKDGGDMFMFTHPHQDPDSAVLNILEFLETLSRSPDEECVTVIQVVGDKDFGDVMEVKEGSCADMK